MQLETHSVSLRAGDKSVNVSIDSPDLLPPVTHHQYFQSIRLIPPAFGWMMGDRQNRAGTDRREEADGERESGRWRGTGNVEENRAG